MTSLSGYGSMAALRRSRPVSYTHLDVYKRKALNDVRIERNTRNGRSQKEHLNRARAVQEVDYPGGTWRRKGAAEKKAQVYAWRQEHPEGRKADCHRAVSYTHLDVYKRQGRERKAENHRDAYSIQRGNCSDRHRLSG